MTAHAATHHDETHASGSKYVQIAIVLFALTALEVLLYETCFGHLRESLGGLSSALAPHFVLVLLLLSALKFWFVAMFYMHLKFDLKILSWVFAFSLIIAIVVIFAVFILFTYNRTLWWANGPWH